MERSHTALKNLDVRTLQTPDQDSPVPTQVTETTSGMTVLVFIELKINLQQFNNDRFQGVYLCVLGTHSMSGLSLTCHFKSMVDIVGPYWPTWTCIILDKLQS